MAKVELAKVGKEKVGKEKVGKEMVKLELPMKVERVKDQKNRRNHDLPRHLPRL
jgi:hypothetical protein